MKNQYEVFASIIKNFATARKANAEAANAEGSANKENARYMDSVQGKIKGLQSAWSQFSNAILKSDTVKNVLSGLTSAVSLLASDFGQLALKVGLFSLGGVGVVKLMPKIVSGFGKIVKAGKALTALNIASTFSSWSSTSADFVKAGGSLNKETGRLTKTFGKLIPYLTNPAIVGGAFAAALLAGSIALAKYVDIGASAKAKKVNENLEQTKKEVDELQGKYQKLYDEREGLKDKMHTDGELTESEQTRLRYLELETEELQRQLQLKAELKADQVEEKYQTVDPKKLTGSMKERYTTAKASGQSDEMALAAAGAYNKLDVAMSQYKDTVQEVSNAYDDYAKKREKTSEIEKISGKNSERYKKAVEEEIAAYDKYDKVSGNTSKALKTLRKQRDKLYDDYGGKDLFDKNASAEIKNSAKEMNKLIKRAKGLNDIKKKGKDVTKTFKQLAEKGNVAGVELSKTGKKISKIDFSQFRNSLKQVGASERDVWENLKAIGEENPNVKVNIDGVDYAVSDLDLINGKIQVLPKSKKSDVGADVDGKQDVDQLDQSIEKVPLTKTSKVSASVSGKGSVDGLRASISQLPDTKTVYINTVRTTTERKKKEAHGTRNFYAKGSKDTNYGNAQVNEYGFEIIRDARTGAMRIANGGLRGNTWLGRGDAVYTHGQSMRMLQKAGLKTSDILQGQKGDVPVHGVRKLKGFASGKKAQEKYNKERDKIRDKYDAAIEKLEYIQEKNHYSDKWLAQQEKKKYKYYTKQMKALNKKYKNKKVKRSKGLSTDQKRDYKLTWSEVFHDAAEASLDSNLKELENGKKTYKQLLALAKKYYKKKKISAKEYQEWLADIEQAEIDRQQKNYENQWDYLSAYIQRQIDLNEKNNDMLEAQNELLQAQSQKVRVYREGQGWVYTENAEAIQEATSNLEEYSSVWEQIQEMMDTAESIIDLKTLEKLSGTNLVNAVKNAGDNVSAWEKIIKLVGGNLGSLNLAEEAGITDLSKIGTTNKVDNTTIKIDKINLPNVTKPSDFVNAMVGLKTSVMQKSTSR